MDSGTTDVYFPLDVFNSIKLSFAKHFSSDLHVSTCIPLTIVVETSTAYCFSFVCFLVV